MSLLIVPPVNYSTNMIQSSTSGISYALPEAYMSAWWKADSLMGLYDASTITTWTDSKFGLVATSSGGSTPQFYCFAIGGMPAVSFDGNSYFSVPTSPLLNFTGDFTVAVVIFPSAWDDHQSRGIIDKKLNDDNVGYTLFNDGTFSPYLEMRLRNADTQFYNFASSSPVSVSAAQLWVYTRVGDLGTFRLNGDVGSAATNVGGDLSNSEPFYIGHNQTWNGFFEGLIAEIVLYQIALSGTALAQLENSLIAKYSIA